MEQTGGEDVGRDWRAVRSIINQRPRACRRSIADQEAGGYEAERDVRRRNGHGKANRERAEWMKISG